MIGMSGSAATRYVALGDSITEGVGDDPHADGTPRGWADRLAELMAAHGPVGYANLAVRGRRTREVVETQLETAAQAGPTVATVSAGVNDLLRPRLDLDALAADLAVIAARLTGVGAQVLFVPLPAVERVTPLGHLLRPRREALNAILADLAQRPGVVAVLPTEGTVFEEKVAWSPDKLHLSAVGHGALARAAAEALGYADLPAPESHAGDPATPGDPRGARRAAVRAEARWVVREAGPWVGRRLTGRSSGDGRSAKRPELTPVS